MRHARQATLEREHEAYRRMEGLPGVPRCFGMVDGRYLVLERIHGIPYRDADIADRETWFAALLQTLQGFHARGVSHGDLKSKDNLMFTDTGQPCVIDFGTTVLLMWPAASVSEARGMIGVRITGLFLTGSGFAE